MKNKLIKEYEGYIEIASTDGVTFGNVGVVVKCTEGEDPVQKAYEALHGQVSGIHNLSIEQGRLDCVAEYAQEMDVE